MPVFNNILAGAAGSGGAADFKIDRSLRFNSGDSAYLSKDFSSAGNRKTFTFSCWIKRCFNDGNSQYIFVGSNASGTSRDDNNFACLRFLSTDQLDFAGENTIYRRTNAKFRDFSAWMHIVLAVDTTNSTASDRVKLYINGVEIDSFETNNNPAQNHDFGINQSNVHTIGVRAREETVLAHYQDAYLADVHFIDGQALAATDFGEYDDNNVWQPKEFEGSYNGTLAKHQGDWEGDTAGTAYSSTLGADKVFDGDDSTGSAPTTSSAYVFTPSPAITGISKVRIRADRDPSMGDDDGLQLNGVAIGNNWSAGGGTSEVEFTVNNLTSLRWETNGVNHWYKLYAVEIYYDGAYHTLVQTAAGVNGFHLDFSDNSSDAALGTDSSGNSNTWTVNNLVAGAGAGYTGSGAILLSSASLNAGSVDNVVDGDLNSSAEIRGAGSFVQLVFPQQQNGTLQVHCENGNDASDDNIRVFIDGTEGTPFDVSSKSWHTIHTGNFTTVKLEHQGSTTGTIYGFRIGTEGATIVNHSGSAADSLIDTPTNYEADSGNNGGNYATLNPLDSSSNADNFPNGSLDFTKGSSYGTVKSTIGMASGKWYCEVNPGSGSTVLGVLDGTNPQNHIDQGSGGYGYRSDGQKYNSGTHGDIGSYSSSDIIGLAFDADAKNIYFYKNGNLQGSFTNITPAVAGSAFFFAFSASSTTLSVNFGQRPFAYTPPTGFLSLCTTNLPDPTIADGSTAMDATLWTGNGTSQTITGLGFSPDFLWVKNRTSATSNYVTDTVRGITKYLITEQTSAEGTNSNRITAVTSDGFSVGTHNGFNDNNNAYVGWTWDAGTSNTTVATNANGSGLPGAECVYRANPSTGFSIVRVASPTSTEARVHGLNKKPDLIICKSTGSADSWHTYHSSLGYTKYINLNGTGGATSSDQFGSQEPTSTYFYVKANTGSGANKSDGMIYYIWTAVAGYSAFGSYTGNGSADGPFVYTGFRPAFVLIRRTDAGQNWAIHDTARDPFNEMNKNLAPNLASQENNSGDIGTDTVNEMDCLSNGFKLRDAAAVQNASGGTYIYAAFAEHPFKTARAR